MVDRDLSIPEEVRGDDGAREFLRAWVTNGGLVCSLRPDAWDQVHAWGIVLADIARHVANAVQESRGDDAAESLAHIRSVFLAELESPTDEPTGHFTE